MKRILLYGGCHALILRDLLAEHFSDRVAPQLLVNFELIRSGEPFDYERLRDVDVVAFSPIENKGAYNTVHLVEACRAMGVDAVCYPWLEWHGYCPGATKGSFKNRFQWRYEALLERAADFPSFEPFFDHVVEAFPDDATIDRTVEMSTRLLRSSEERNDMAVRVSDFILERHRDTRLFFISDHPSLALYLHVLGQLLAILGIESKAACERIARSAEEPQWRWRTPILPRVAARLGLRFEDARWVDDEIVPGRDMDLRSYLRLYYYPDSVILAPTADRPIIVSRQPPGERTVEPGTRLVADRLPGLADPDEYRLLDVLSGDASPIARHERFGIQSHQWRSRWDS